MKKILIIHTKYRNLGGEDIAVENEVSILSKYFEIETLYFSNQGVSIFSDLISFITNNNVKSNKLLEEKINDFQPEIVIVHNTWFKANLGIFRILENKNITTFLKIHNFRYVCTSSFTKKAHLFNNNICQACGVKYKKTKVFNKYFYDSIMKSLAVLNYGRKYLEILNDEKINLLVLTAHHKNFLNEYLSSNKQITILPNILDLKTDEDGPDSSNNEKYIVYAGRISLEKGVDNLISAFKNAQVKNVKLKIIGEGPELIYLKNKYKDDTNIIFLGQLTNDKVTNQIKRSTLVITATKLFEGQPTLLSEASLLGVPSIFPETGGISEFFPPNYQYTFEQYDYKDLENKIRHFFLKADRKNLGEKNQKFIEKYLDEKLIINSLKQSLGI